MTMDTLDILRDETRCNYYETVVALRDQPPCPIRNTAELFAFGNYLHYLKYRPHFLELDAPLLLKLIKLTILAMCGENEGRTVLIDEMEQEYRLQSAIQHYTDVAGAPTECHLFESILFSMVDDAWIDVKIDDVHLQVRIIKCIRLRDAFCSIDVKLHVLTEEDIARNAGTSYAKLDNWLRNNVAPTRQAMRDT
jgi:hypothetical protein